MDILPSKHRKDGPIHGHLKNHVVPACIRHPSDVHTPTTHRCANTGWKIGYVAAPASLMAEFRKVHQYNVFSVNTPMQHGLANYMADPAPYLDLPAFYQRKRDLFRDGLQGSRFTLLPADGTYFQCVRYDAMPPMPESDFAQWLTTDIEVAAIPVSAFYSQGQESGIVRFCFAKHDDTLRLALERLARL